MVPYIGLKVWSIPRPLCQPSLTRRQIPRHLRPVAGQLGQTAPRYGHVHREDLRKWMNMGIKHWMDWGSLFFVWNIVETQILAKIFIINRVCLKPELPVVYHHFPHQRCYLGAYPIVRHISQAWLKTTHTQTCFDTINPSGCLSACITKIYPSNCRWLYVGKQCENQDSEGLLLGKGWFPVDVPFNQPVEFRWI